MFQKNYLKEHNYIRVMYEVQRCIELLVKALLAELNVEYKTKGENFS
jgi:HEPN domain-containing protein